MRVLRPVVCSQAPIVLSREPDRAECCRIGSQPVGHNPTRRKAVLLKQFHHEFLCGVGIPAALDEEIQHLNRSHPMMLIGDQPQSYPSYRDIAGQGVHPVIRNSARLWGRMQSREVPVP